MRLASLLVLFSFLNVQLVAIVIGYLFIAQGISVVENSASLENSVVFFGYIVASAVVVLLVLKFYKGKNLFAILELVLLLITTSILLALFVPELYSYVGGVAAVAIRLMFPKTKMLWLLFVSAIVAALLGSSLDILPAALLGLLLALYDFSAVFLTKHMVQLAEQLRGRDAAFSITFPAPAPLQKIFAPEKKGEKAKKAKAERKFEAVELGTGDFVIPGMIIVSASKLSIFHAFAALAGAFLGIALLFYYIDKRKGYWPALPPVIFPSLLFLAAYHFLLAPLL